MRTSLRSQLALGAASAFVTVFITMLASTTASAQQAGTVSMNRFDASERGSEWFVNESLDLRGKVRPSAGIVFDGQYRTLAIYDSAGKLDGQILRNIGTLRAGGSLVLFDRLRIGLDLPMVVYQDSGDKCASAAGCAYRGVTYTQPAQQALGDLRVGADVRLLGEYGSKFQLAAGLQVHFPTGSAVDYTSDNTVRFAPRVMAAGDLGPFVYAARIGFMLNRRNVWVADTAWGHEANFSIAAGLRLGHLVVGPELWGSTVLASSPPTLNAPSQPNTNAQIAVEGLLGAHYTAGAFRFGGGVATGLTRGLGEPMFRWLLNAEFVMPLVEDTDSDGIKDDKDACPADFGVPDPDPKKHGCPSDKDADGVIDDVDACPEVPGPKANKGCPPDQDGDGITDASDACPDVPGVKENKGCPADRDADGVWDKDDACPDVAGVKENKGCPADRDVDGIVDTDDACPDEKGITQKKKEFNGCGPDVDGDGITNDDDACPKESGKPSTDPAKNGCPLAFVKGGEIKITEQVKFKVGKAEIERGRDSEDILQAVFDVLKAHPEIKKVGIEGHTDNQGKADFNKKLSADRAAAVVAWLVKKGVEKARLESKGFGQDRPLDSNSTEVGRMNNRRVEFHIVGEGDPGATPPPSDKPKDAPKPGADKPKDAPKPADKPKDAPKPADKPADKPKDAPKPAGDAGAPKKP
jgi:outer membrane protein OmpA-like peptidoglycan-associated protein